MDDLEERDIDEVDEEKEDIKEQSYARRDYNDAHGL